MLELSFLQALWYSLSFKIVVVQSLSHFWLFATPWAAAHQASLFFIISWSLLKLTSVIPFSHLILCCPLLLPPSIFPSIRVFSNESVLCIRWPAYCSFSFSISPSNIQDWFPLGLTGLISLLFKGLSRVFSSITVWKHVFWCSAFSHPYMTTGKTIVLAIWTFVHKDF